MTDLDRATDRFDGRRALVTGGASGIGRATAELLLERGAAVALLDRDPEAVEEAGTAMRATAAVSADVRDPGAVGAAVRQAAERLGGAADVLVNAAGIYRVCRADDLDETAWNEVLDTNLRGTFIVAQEFRRQLRASPPSTTEQVCVVNMASTAAMVADPGEPAAHYNASKAGVVALTKQLAVEWAADGVRVNAVAPGVIDTPMLRMMDDPEAGRGYLDARVPLRRLGRADEVAEVVVFLASARASYITGATVVVDGGVTAS